jgi:hypothetical protein
LRKNEAGGRRGDRGQVLAGVIMLLVILLIMVPALVQWVQIESKASVRDQKNTIAFNLAQAAVERGYWKIKSSTETCLEALAGTVITGYNDDVTYTDVSGGTYRIMFSSGPSTKQVTVVGEGRDSSTHEVRAISAVYQNNTLYSPIMSQGTVQETRGLIPYWGPILSQGDIVINDDDIGNIYYPLKYAQGVVWCNNTGAGTCTDTAAKNERDINGLTPPNTDNSEWWSDYPYVPEVPVLDFAAFKTSATLTNTLNIYGCAGNATNPRTGSWDARATGGCTTTLTSSHALHFGNSWNHLKSPQFNFVNGVTTNSYVWYWDGDVTLTGTGCGANGYPCGNGTGLLGDIIVRGNLTIDSPGDYFETMTVPPNAWEQHERLGKATYDTAASGEYPADIGLHLNSATFTTGITKTGTAIGTTFTIPGLSGSVVSTPGIHGFVYVGGNLFIQNSLDINGVVWVKGSIGTAGANLGYSCGVFYDNSLTVPTLNVILTRESWKEILPSSTAWH